MSIICGCCGTDKEVESVVSKHNQSYKHLCKRCIGVLNVFLKDKGKGVCPTCGAKV